MSEEIRQYKYDAFISYRHSELDKFVAENLHTQMETFKLPGNIKRSGVTTRKKIERVFRDQEELPLATNLEDPIVQALRDSEYLIVICSPRLKESMWCRREIETFVRLHGKDKILAVLVEGEPGESFPPELLYYDETLQYPDGRMERVRHQLDPLAADVRGRDKKEILKAMETEKLRLLAPMFGVGFDDLRQRHRERKMHKMITLVSVIAGVFLLFAGVSLFAALNISKQKQTIEDQAVEIGAQLEEITAQAKEIETQYEKLTQFQAQNLADKAEQYYEKDERWLAIETAAKALTEYEGVEMPYTEEAQYILTKALHLYNNGRTLKADWQINTVARVSNIVASDSGRYMAVFDCADNMQLWDTTERKKILETKVYGSSLNSSDCSYAFIGDEKILYIDCDGMLNEVELATGKNTVKGEIGHYSFYVDSLNEKLYYSVLPQGSTFGVENICCYDLKTDVVTEIPVEKNIKSITINHEANAFILLCMDGSIDDGDESIVVIDAETLEERCVIPRATYDTITAVLEDGTDTYVAVSHFDVFDTQTFNTYNHANTILYRIDAESGHVVWEQNYFSTTMGELFAGIDDDIFYAVSGGFLYQIDKQTGTPVKELVTSSTSIVGHTKVLPSGNFYAFFPEGQVGYANFAAEVVVVDPTDLKSGIGYAEKVLPLETGYAMFANEDTRVVIYKSGWEKSLIAMNEADYVDTDALNIYESYRFLEAKGLAESYNLPNKEIVKYLFYNDDKSLMFVSLETDLLEVYTVNGSKCKLIETIDTSDLGSDPERYVGKDQYGNIYISGSTVGAADGLCLDGKSFKPIACIEGLLAVENDHLIQKDSSGNQATSPIYTLDDILNMVNKSDYQPE